MIITRRSAILLLAVTCGGLLIANAVGSAQSVGAPRRPITSGAASRHELVFELVTSNTAIGRWTDDQITIVFSDSSGEISTPPSPLFGQDILAEFSFSGLDA